MRLAIELRVHTQRANSSASSCSLGPDNSGELSLDSVLSDDI